MILRRFRNQLAHNGQDTHRNLRPHDRGGWHFQGTEVVLSQMKPRGLWRFTSRDKISDDRILDEQFGEMPLKIAVAKLRLL